MEVQVWQVFSWRFGFPFPRKSHLHVANVLCLWKKKTGFCVRFPVSLKGVCSLKVLSKAHVAIRQARQGTGMSLACPLEGEKAAKEKMKLVEIKVEWEGERKSSQGEDVESHQSRREGLRLFASRIPLGSCFAFICIPLNFWRSFHWFISSLTGSWLLGVLFQFKEYRCLKWWFHHLSSGYCSLK